MGMPWEDVNPAEAPPPPTNMPWEDIRPGESSGGAVAQSAPSLQPQDTLSKTYHAVLQGGALTAGSMAGGALGTLADPVLGPIGTMGGAIAGASSFYPAGKYVADAIDKIRGVATEQQSLPQQMATGAKQEMMGQAIGAVAPAALSAVGSIMPGAKVGEAISGTPASNLSRAYKNGFVKTFVDPIPLKDASEQYGDEFNRVMGDHFTPEQQADLLLNPQGMAKEALSSAIVKSQTGEQLTTQEAIAAKRGIDQLMPAGTAKNLPRIKGFGTFDQYLNDVIAKQDPAFKEANDVYAASKLRDQLLKFGQVNKSNPNEYSKLGMLMFETMAGVAGIGGKSLGDAGKVLALQQASSPFAMGLVSSASGGVSRATASALANPLIQRAAASALDTYFGGQGTAPGQANSPAMGSPAMAGSGSQQ
jgi:hypothetical protein